MAFRAATRSIASQPEWDERGPRHEVNVFEVAGLDAAAERALWEWIASIDLVSHVEAFRTPVPHPLFLQLADPKRLGLLVGDGLWVRLIDLPRALEARAYEGSCAIALEVTDRVQHRQRRPLARGGHAGRGSCDAHRRRARPRSRHSGPRRDLPRRPQLHRPSPSRPIAECNDGALDIARVSSSRYTRSRGPPPCSEDPRPGVESDIRGGRHAQGVLGRDSIHPGAKRIASALEGAPTSRGNQRTSGRLARRRRLDRVSTRTDGGRHHDYDSPASKDELGCRFHLSPEWSRGSEDNVAAGSSDHL